MSPFNEVIFFMAFDWALTSLKSGATNIHNIVAIQWAALWSWVSNLYLRRNQKIIRDLHNILGMVFSYPKEQFWRMPSVFFKKIENKGHPNDYFVKFSYSYCHKKLDVSNLIHFHDKIVYFSPPTEALRRESVRM